MGRLRRLEINNFKSYRDNQVIDFGDAHFTSVIGPNGCGKSNLMDAISFVLGIKSSHLRSTQLRDLIYRGRLAAADFENTVVEDDHDDDEASQDTQRRPRTASITAIYEKDDEGTILKLTRSIVGSQGSSEYRINGKVVTAQHYGKVLEGENILIKARNFLVFQGDVEAIASQSPQDLTNLIEHISRSIEYKVEYEDLKRQLDDAEEHATLAFSKKRGYNAEMKHYAQLKSEADRFDAQIAKKESLHLNLFLWEALKCEQAIQHDQEKLGQSQQTYRKLAKDNDKASKQVSTHRSKIAQITSQGIALRNQIQQLKRQIEERLVKSAPIGEKLNVLNQNISRNKTKQDEIELDGARQEERLNRLKQQLANVEDELAGFAAEFERANRESGISGSLTDADRSEYESLMETFNRQAASDKMTLGNMSRQLTRIKERLSVVESKVNGTETDIDRLQKEVESVRDREKQLNTRYTDALQKFEEKKRQVIELSAARMKRNARETEVSEKLHKCLNQLLDVNTSRRESDRERKFLASINSLKQIYPGVHGRLVDLCKPKQAKYGQSISMVLGKDADSIVVDSQSTATECIRYMREQRVGVATFIPLESVAIPSVQQNLRSLHEGVRLAIDVVDYDASNERALQYACGNTVICDNLKIAKQIRWGDGNKNGVNVKAVTLDGEIIHKAGLMTGGQTQESQKSGNKFETQNIQGLTKLKDSLIQELEELAKEKRNDNQQEQLESDIQGLEAKLEYIRQELGTVKQMSQSRLQELEFSKRQLSTELIPKQQELQQEFNMISPKVTRQQGQIEMIQDKVFKTFCHRLGMDDIRKFQELQGSLMQKLNENKLKLSTRKIKIENQIQFEEARIEETRARITRLEKMIQSQKDQITELERENNKIKKRISDATLKLDELNAEANDNKEELAEMNEKLRELQEVQSQTESQLSKAASDVAAIQSDLQRQASGRLNVLYRCKVENIRLPLKKGSLDNIPLTDAAVTAIESHIAQQQQSTSQEDGDMMGPINVEDYGVEIDYSKLKKNKEADSMIEELNKELKDVETELEKMNPNLKAGERLEGVESRLQETDSEFSKLRKRAKIIRDKFNRIRDKRYHLFNKAFSHISEEIDSIYKEMTKSNSFPLGGTAYLTLEDVDEPYLSGIRYHAMPPMKQFRDMEQLSGGEKTIAALSLLFSIHSFHPSPFFILDEVDAALDNANVSKVANFIQNHSGPKLQFIVISLKSSFFQQSDALVGVYRKQDENSSKVLTIDLRKYDDK